MAGMTYEGAYRVSGTGTTVTSGAASANVAIPNAGNGSRARVIRLQVTGNAYVKLGNSGVTATNNDLLLSPNFDVLLMVQGNTHIAYLQEAVAARVNITPLEA